MSSAVFEERREMRAIDKRIGRLQGYALAFNQPGLPFLEPGFANIRSDRNGEVHGVLWKISADDFARLDLHEGGGDAYDRLVVRVDTDEGRINARTYITQQVIEGLRPSRRYRDLLVQGAREAGLEPGYIARLAQTRAFEVPVLSRLSPMIIRLFEKAFARGLNPKPLFAAYWDRRRDA